MSEFEDKLNHILSDPQEMEKISRLAASLMGSGTDDEPKSPAIGAGEFPDLKRLLSGLGSVSSEKTALLTALSPYLQPQRRQKLLKALRLAQAARIAGAALETYGG